MVAGMPRTHCLCYGITPHHFVAILKQGHFCLVQVFFPEYQLVISQLIIVVHFLRTYQYFFSTSSVTQVKITTFHSHFLYPFSILICPVTYGHVHISEKLFFSTILEWTHFLRKFICWKVAKTAIMSFILSVKNFYLDYQRYLCF